MDQRYADIGTKIPADMVVADSPISVVSLDYAFTIVAAFVETRSGRIYRRYSPPRAISGDPSSRHPLLEPIRTLFGAAADTRGSYERSATIKGYSQIYEVLWKDSRFCLSRRVSCDFGPEITHTDVRFLESSQANSGESWSVLLVPDSRKVASGLTTLHQGFPPRSRTTRSGRFFGLVATGDGLGAIVS